MDSPLPYCIPKPPPNSLSALPALNRAQLAPPVSPAAHASPSHHHLPRQPQCQAAPPPIDNREASQPSGLQASATRSPLRRLALPGQPLAPPSALAAARHGSTALQHARAAAAAPGEPEPAPAPVYGAAAFPVYASEGPRSRRACTQNDPTRFVRARWTGAGARTLRRATPRFCHANLLLPAFS